ncbi:hypothetical protein ACPXCP_37380, partial [Streptomyces sp. DT20]|uniref:hypothetical protein n=1 Tax=Streptomyces sp. DT20 TaxID=3416519 RepID=UPI003CF1ACA8
MARRKNPVADRLARLEDASRESIWQRTLEDGTTAALPVVTVMDALAELFGFPVDADQDDDEPSSGPPRLTLTHEIRLLARVAEGLEVLTEASDDVTVGLGARWAVRGEE